MKASHPTGPARLSEIVPPPASEYARGEGVSLACASALASNDTTMVFADLIPDSVRTWGVVCIPASFSTLKVQGPKPVFVLLLRRRTERALGRSEV